MKQVIEHHFKKRPAAFAVILSVFFPCDVLSSPVVAVLDVRCVSNCLVSFSVC